MKGTSPSRARGVSHEVCISQQVSATMERSHFFINAADLRKRESHDYRNAGHRFGKERFCTAWHWMQPASPRWCPTVARAKLFELIVAGAVPHRHGGVLALTTGLASSPASDIPSA